jgi:hypothetical protein
MKMLIIFNDLLEVRLANLDDIEQYHEEDEEEAYKKTDQVRHRAEMASYIEVALPIISHIPA